MELPNEWSSLAEHEMQNFVLSATCVNICGIEEYASTILPMYLLDHFGTSPTCFSASVNS